MTLSEETRRHTKLSQGNPKLLDWIANDFMRGRWSLKRLHRLIVTSTVFRQTSTRRKKLDAIDPDNRLLDRMPVRRLEAERIGDYHFDGMDCK